MEQRSIQAEAQERIFVGIPAAPGIAIGPAYLFNKREVVVKARRISEAEVTAELERFGRRCNGPSATWTRSARWPGKSSARKVPRSSKRNA